MIANLRRTWPVLAGVLLVLFSSQQAAAILLAPPARLPLQGFTPALEEAAQLAAPVAARQQPAQAFAITLQETDANAVPALSFSMPGLHSPSAIAEIPPRQDVPVSVPPGPPIRLVIPAIELDAPVLPAQAVTVSVGGNNYKQWEAPDQFAAGWHTSSAELGSPGNTVLNGHHNIDGEVFRRLEDLSTGDMILVHSFEGLFGYEIANLMILPEKYEQLDTRMANAQWIMPSQDERLTLITCWPYESNTHRLIIVARPVFRERIVRELQ